jgi:molybdenum-dependent DNA-binding transcriptional regulator ModE
MAKRRLEARLEIETEAGAVLGGARIRLLEAVDKFGSISKAAQRIPMSYKAAWDALDDLNNLAGGMPMRLGAAAAAGCAPTAFGAPSLRLKYPPR